MSKITKIIEKSKNKEYKLMQCPNCKAYCDEATDEHGVYECKFCDSSWVNGPDESYYTLTYRSSLKISLEQLAKLSDAELLEFKNPNTIYTCDNCETTPLYYPEQKYCPECGCEADFDEGQKIELGSMKYHNDSKYAGTDWTCHKCKCQSSAIAENCYNCGRHKEMQSSTSRGEETIEKYQMLWDCPACQTKGLLGIDHRFCPNCGSAQDADKRYFPEEGKEVAAKDHKFQGADWLCKYCKNPNSNLAHSCPCCGGDKEGTQGPKRTTDENYVSPSEKIQAVQEATKGLGKFKWPAIGCGSLLVLIIGFMIFAALWTKEEVLVIDHHSWRSEIKLQTFVEFSDSSFCDEMNSKIYRGYRSKIQYKKSKEFDKQKIQDGETCTNKKVDKGDGTFAKQKICEPNYIYKPIMKDFCTFSNVGWAMGRNFQASGDGQDFVYPEYLLLKTGECLGCEKLDQKIAQFKLHMMSEGQMKSCDVERPIWEKFRDGQKVVVKVKNLGGGLNCSDLKTMEK